MSILDLFPGTVMQCTVCGAEGIGTCDCWDCATCGRRFGVGDFCSHRTPKHEARGRRTEKTASAFVGRPRRGGGR